METLRRLSFLVALVIAAGETARYWGKAAFVPMAFDELAVAAALAWTAMREPRAGPAPLLAAWGGFCGLMLVLLVQNADHVIHGRPKANGWIYVAALSMLLLLGVWAVRRALWLLRRGQQGANHKA